MNRWIGRLLVSGVVLTLYATASPAEYGRHLLLLERESLFKELEQAPFAIEGAKQSPTSVLYVIFDANCPYCHAAWKMLQPYEKAGLQVRWVPVAFLAPSSFPKAVAILEATDRTAAFREVMQNFGRHDGALVELAARAKPETATSLQKNLELMRRLGIRGTPGLVWRDQRGGVTVKGALPRLSELPAITGLPEQKIDDPELEKFR